MEQVWKELMESRPELRGHSGVIDSEVIVKAQGGDELARGSVENNYHDPPLWMERHQLLEGVRTQRKTGARHRTGSQLHLLMAASQRIAIDK